jgi:alkaline phosphatase D
MPVRMPRPDPAAPFGIERIVSWGGLIDLVLLDGRQFRSDQACGSPVLSLEPPCPEASDPARTMLGEDQEAWVGQVLAESAATWTTICQQTVLSDVRFDGAILNYDQWDGYAPARDRLLAQMAAADRVVVLTGDIHLAAVGRLPGIGAELVTSAISSAANVDPALEPIVASFPSLVAIELIRRGYIRHTVTPQQWTAEYRAVADVARADSPVDTWRRFVIDAATPDDPRPTDLAPTD